MEIYNSPNVDLPPFKIDKSRQRQKLEDDQRVSTFIRSNRLLDADFVKLFGGLFSKTDEINRLLGLATDSRAMMSEYLFRRNQTKKTLREAAEIIFFPREKRTDQEIKIARKKLMANILVRLQNESSKIQSELDSFEKSKGCELSILISTTVHCCKECNSILSRDRFRTCQCACGKKISVVEDTKEISLHHLNGNLMEFIKSNYWLEYGVDFLLRKLNLQTEVGLMILGHSGNIHEIDNIAESKPENHRFFCECKVGEPNISELFVFAGKMKDIGCTKGYIFTANPEVSEKVNRLGRANNISIITDVLNKSLRELIAELEGNDLEES